MSEEKDLPEANLPPPPLSGSGLVLFAPRVELMNGMKERLSLGSMLGSFLTMKVEKGSYSCFQVFFSLGLALKTEGTKFLTLKLKPGISA